jgi:prophage tail gpP-like protein
LFTGLAVAKEKRGTTQTVTVELASRAKVLNDCAAPQGFDVPAGSLTTFAAQLAGQLGVPITAVGAVPRTTPIRANDTQTVWSILSSLAKENNAWMWTDAAGVVHLEPLASYYMAPPVDKLLCLPGGPQAAGNNVVDYRLRDDSGQRYSHIIVRGQGSQRAVDGNAATGLLSYPVLGQAIDPELSARGVYRPYVIDDGDARTIAQAVARATREMMIRRIDGTKIEIEVGSWTTAAGVPWQTTQMVAVSIPTDGIAGTFMIAGRRLLLDKTNGYRARLTLIEPGML